MKKLFLKTSKNCTKYTHFKKSFFIKLLGSVSRLYSMFYAFSAHVVIIFYVPYTQGNRLVTIRVSPDVSNILWRRRKRFFQFGQKVTWMKLKSMSKFRRFLAWDSTSNQLRIFWVGVMTMLYILKSCSWIRVWHW